MVKKQQRSSGRIRIFLALAGLTIVMAAPAYAAYVPWDALTNDSWISGASPAAKIYTVNSTGYTLAFGTKNANGSARGVNAARFSDGVNSTGHLQSNNLTGSFNILNNGGQNFSKVLVLVAIQSDVLSPDFSMSSGVSGVFSYNFNPATDFCYYNHPEYSSGRPTGYYSATTPTGDGIAYNFQTGFVSVYELMGVSVAAGSSVAVNYSFANLPSRAVFSVYAIQSGSSITHTNRSILDTKDATATISTFEVVPEPATMLLIACGAGILRMRKTRP
jgi:hypothetical protein